MMNLPTIPFIFSIIFTQIILAHINDVERNQQKVEFLSKLNFKLSNNFYYAFIDFDKGIFHGEYFIENEAKSTKHMAVDHPNIDVTFYLDKMNNIRCDYVLWGEVEKFVKHQCSHKICVKRRNLENGWRMELPVLPHLYLPPAVMKSNPPSNIADLKTALNELSEHDILRTCSAAYFYRGFSTSNENSTYGRTSWMLYLLEGKLECILEGKSEEENRKLLAKGYKIKFSQINDEWTPADPEKMKIYCGLHATLSQFSDENNEEGNFLVGGIIGSAQLDKYDKKVYEKKNETNEEKSFWAWRKVNNKLEPYPEGCALKYLSSLTTGRSEFLLKIEVEHWCHKDDKYMSTHQLTIFWLFQVEQEKYGIFDWKQRLNDENAHAILNLANGSMIMPNGFVLKGKTDWKEIETSSKKKVKKNVPKMKEEF